MLFDYAQINQVLIKKAEELRKRGFHGVARGVDTARDEIRRKGASVEAEKIVHAHWIDQGHGCPPECSICGREPRMIMNWIRPDFCPWCGAWMDADDPKNEDDGGYGDYD